MRFLKTAIVGGFFVLLPIVLLWLVLVETFDIVLGLLQPVVDLLPVEEVGGVPAARIAAALLILLICFATGAIMRTRAGLAVGRWIERTFLLRLPAYGLIKTLTQRFSGAATDSRFAPALVDNGDGVREVAFIIDEHAAGDVTVLVPLAPTPNIGSLRVVRRDCLQRIEAPMGAVVNSVMQWGIGSQELFQRTRPFGEHGEER